MISSLQDAVNLLKTTRAKWIQLANQAETYLEQQARLQCAEDVQIIIGQMIGEDMLRRDNNCDDTPTGYVNQDR